MKPHIPWARISATQNRRWLRAGLFSALGIVLLLGIGALAYELALARVPENRAKLERLVRAHTGLDVRFNELIVRWGWYGPEAVFRSVEVGEPGRSVVLLRAPQLVVGFDAWRTLQSGQLALGRITLVAPDIDLERTTRQSRTAQPGASRATNRFSVLQRWRGGRIEIEGGTLRLPDPKGSANPLTLQLRRATLRRSDDDWSAYALLFLPERLGRTARITVQWQGDLDNPATSNGSMRFDGTRLVFAGWRDYLGTAPRVSGVLPTSGGGDLSVRLNFKRGRLQEGDGKIRAYEVEFGGATLPDPTRAAGAPRLSFEQLRANWQLVQRGAGWHVQIADLGLSRDRNERALPTMNLEIERGVHRVHGELERAPATAVFALARWFAPHLRPGDVRLDGTAHDIRFDWNSVQPAGRRLHATARFDGVGIESASRGFALTGLTATAVGSETDLTLQLESENAHLVLSDSPEDSLENLRISSRVQLRQAGDNGWQLVSDRIALEHESAQLFLDGMLTGDVYARSPLLKLHGVLLGADIGKLQQTLGKHLAINFGAAADRLTAGRIENGQFDLQGSWDELAAGAEPQAFRGSLELREAKLAGGDSWPDVDLQNARVQWNGARVRADVKEARSGALQLSSVEAEWHANGERATRVSGEARGRLQDALAMLRKYPQMRERTPQLQNLVARGNAEFDFAVTLPPQAQAKTPADVRLTAIFDGAQLQLAPELPALEAVRGSLAFDGGRMQRSTLTGSWFGGPVTLRVAERREQGAPALAIEARGMLDAKQLTRLAQVEELRELSGQTPWTGELIYQPPAQAQPARIRARLDANLVGVTSRLPEPLAKAEGAQAPLHLDITATDDSATLRISIPDRLRAAFRLQRPDANWHVERGTVRLGGGAAALPEDERIAVVGRVSRLDLPAYVSLWQRLRDEVDESSLALDMDAEQMSIAGRVFRDVNLKGRTDEDNAQLEIESPAVKGVVRWPAGERAAEVRFARLQLPERTQPGEMADALVALGNVARISVDRFTWGDRVLGQFSAHLQASDEGVVLQDVRLEHETHDAQGTLRCEPGLVNCDLGFKLRSTDVAATLADFGFRPELSATAAELEGEVQWQGDAQRSWLDTLAGQMHLRIADGVTRHAEDRSLQPFPLLTVPALLTAAAQSAAPKVVQPATGTGELRFARLEGDFRIRDGVATTSDLHFDGDAEILVRGSASLVAHSYDHIAWILRGSERMPESVRRFGDAPRVAAAWLTLRELFGDDAANRSRTVLRLRGSWDEPVVSTD